MYYTDRHQITAIADAQAEAVLPLHYTGRRHAGRQRPFLFLLLYPACPATGLLPMRSFWKRTRQRSSSCSAADLPHARLPALERAWEPLPGEDLFGQAAPPGILFDDIALLLL